MSNMGNKIKIGVIFLAAGFLFAMDIFLKYLAEVVFNGQKVSLAGGWLNFHLFKNSNLAFSLPMRQEIIIFVGLAVVGCLLYYFVVLLKHDDFSVKPASLLFIILGAASNLHDRINYGYVVDYIDLAYWPTVFNVADIMICAGLASLLLVYGKKLFD